MNSPIPPTTTHTPYGHLITSLKSILGDNVSTHALSALLQDSRGDITQAVNLFFENPTKYQSLPLPPQQGTKRKATTALPTTPTKRPNNGLHYIGETVLVAYSTVKGAGYVREGDEIDPVSKDTAVVLKTLGKGGKGRGRPKSGKNGGSTGPITRFRVKGKEIGKMSMEDAKVFGRLVEMGVVVIRGTVVSAPHALTMMCDILLQIQIYLTPQAFSSTPSPTQPTQSNTESDHYVKERKIAILTLFKSLGLRPASDDIIAAEKDFDTPTPGTATANDQADEEEKELEEDQVEVLYEKARVFESVPEMEPSEGLLVELRGYQKQALFWMSSKENLSNDPSSHSIHPLWEEYSFPKDGGVDIEKKFYFNPYTSELSLQFPSAADRTRGGILADEMGLGKTLETLSLIHTNRPPSDIPTSTPPYNPLFPTTTTTATLPSTRATLIICPVSLLSQWRDEITNRFRPGTLTCAVYYGNERNLTVSDVLSPQAPDVIITTYGVVMTEWERCSRGGVNKKGLLFGVEWFRIVLDEAHWIKNRATATARSCFGLAGRRRWVVTGTPIQNKLDDLFSLVHFLRIDPWSNISFWRQFITLPFANKDPKALSVVQSILEPLVLRRQKSTKLPNGQPIVSLPQKIVEIEYLDFTKEERDVYEALWKKTKTQFSAFVREGTLLKRFTHVFQMITRLRQCCLHPVLALGGGGGGENSKSGESDEFGELVKRFQGGGEGDEYLENVMKKLAGGQDSNEEDKSCPICFDLMTRPTVFPCLHVSCWECVVGYLQKRVQRGEKGECPICRREFGEEDLMDVVVGEGKENLGQDRAGQPMIRLRRHFHPSTKLAALIGHLTRLRDTTPEIKTVVFSQFTSMLSLCEIVLTDHNFSFVRLDGTMTQKEREAALKSFASEDHTTSPTVLLASTRTAGVGLNLTRASFVIMLEPWWNAPVEAQTVDRVHRIGQMREVLVKRFVVRGSVEERMVGVQERKRVLSEWVVGEGRGREKEGGGGRMEELRVLFDE